MRERFILSAFILLAFLAFAALKVIPTPDIQQLSGPVIGPSGVPGGLMSATQLQRQTFVPKSKYIYGASLNFSYWDKIEPDTIIILKLSSIEKKTGAGKKFSDEKVISEDRVQAVKLIKNMDYLFWFGKRKVKKNQLYVLTLSTNKITPSAITAWASSHDAYFQGQHFEGDRPLKNDLIFQIYDLKSLTEIVDQIKERKIQQDNREAHIHKGDGWMTKYKPYYYPMVSASLIWPLIIMLAIASSWFFYLFP